MIKRNKYQAILAKARNYKFRPRTRIRFMAVDFVCEPGMSGFHHNGNVVKMFAIGSFDRAQVIGEEKTKLGALGSFNANGRKYELRPYQQAALDALNTLSLNNAATPVEERDYFNMRTQGVSTTPFLKPELMDKAMTETNNNLPTLSEFIERNAKLRAEAKKKLLATGNIGDVLDKPVGFSPISQLCNGGFKPGELIVSGITHNQYSGHQVSHGLSAFIAMQQIELDFKKKNPEATEEEVFTEIYKGLNSFQHQSLYQYAEQLKKSMETGIIEEEPGVFDALFSVYKYITSFIDFLNSNQPVKNSCKEPIDNL